MDLMRLKGIGPVFAGRIVKYRKSLGGFISIEQLHEVYGISDSLYNLLTGQLILGDSVSIRKIDINNVTQNDLGIHPYFRNFRIRNALIGYRKQHGKFNSVDDLRKIYALNDSILDKWIPYIEFK